MNRAESQVAPPPSDVEVRAASPADESDLHVYTCTDPEHIAVEVIAAGPETAAALYVKGRGEVYGPRVWTYFVPVRTHHAYAGDCGTYKVAIEPVVPPCTDAESTHAWGPETVRRSIVGTVNRSVCERCGCAQLIKTGGCDPHDGTRETVSRYIEANDNWAAAGDGRTL